MQSAEEEVDAEVGDDDWEEGEDEVPIHEAWIAEDWQWCAMKWEWIDEHSDECPHLFGVPTPVATPWHICPNSTDEDASSQKEESNYI